MTEPFSDQVKRLADTDPQDPGPGLRQQLDDLRQQNPIQLLDKANEIFEKWRPVYEADLFRFSAEVLDYKLLSPDLHGSLADLMVPKKEFLLLIPRDHYKSTLFTISASLWDAAKDQDTRIYITNAVGTMSGRFLSEMKEHMQTNALLKSLWPKVFYLQPERESPKWTETEATVKRTRSGLKEATFTAGSVGKMEVGSHFDKHLYDDVVNFENVATPEQILKVLNWYRMSLAMLVPGGTEWIIGTRYDFSDLYGTLISEGYPHKVLKCGFSDGKPILPERYDMKELRKRRQKSGSFIFSCQYENEPVDPETAAFKKQHLQYWTELPALNLYLLIDLSAFSQDKKACETALILLGMSGLGDLYWREDASGIMTPTKFMDELFRIYEKYKPQVGIEKMQAEKVMEFWLREYAKQNHKPLIPYHKLKPDMKKERRILNLQPFWEQNHCYLKPGMTDLEDQFLKFPKFNKRDRIDASAYIVQMATRPKKDRPPRIIRNDYGRRMEYLNGKWVEIGSFGNRKGPVSLMTY